MSLSNGTQMLMLKLTQQTFFRRILLSFEILAELFICNVMLQVLCYSTIFVYVF